MPSSPWPEGAGSAGQAPEVRLLAAAVRLARIFPAAQPVLGVLRCPGRADRDRARSLLDSLSGRGLCVTELSALPEAGERHHAWHMPHARVGLLVYGGPQSEEAMRAAARWQLPLLIERPDADERGRLNAFGAHRRAVAAVHPGAAETILAVRELALVARQPNPGTVRLIVNNEKLVTSGEHPLCIHLTGEGELRIQGAGFGVRHGTRLRFEKAWGAYRLDIDGVPGPDVRAPLLVQAQPGRLHLLHPCGTGTPRPDGQVQSHIT